MAVEFPLEAPVAAPVSVAAEIPATVQAVASGGGLFGRITSFVWAPFRLLASPIAYFAERFGPGVFAYIKDRILSADNITYRNYGSARKIGKAGNVTSTTNFRSGVVLPTIPDAPIHDLPNAPGTRFYNLGDAQVIDSCNDITTTTTFG